MTRTNDSKETIKHVGHSVAVEVVHVVQSLSNSQRCMQSRFSNLIGR